MQNTSQLIMALEKILLLTEMDAFEARLPESPLEAWFPEYEGVKSLDPLVGRFLIKLQVVHYKTRAASS